MLTPRQAPPQYAPPMQRADDGYIYPADGSYNGARYPAPRGSRRLYDAQSYPQPQYYDNRGYAPQYAPPQPYYQPRGLFQDLIAVDSGARTTGRRTAESGPDAFGAPSGGQWDDPMLQAGAKGLTAPFRTSS